MKRRVKTNMITSNFLNNNFPVLGHHLFFNILWKIKINSSKQIFPAQVPYKIATILTIVHCIGVYSKNIFSGTIDTYRPAYLMKNN
jgi:hypothetical protein